MTELHPEDLLHRHGALGPDEHTRLSAHLLRCPECRLELAVRRAAEEELGELPAHRPQLMQSIEAVVGDDARVVCTLEPAAAVPAPRRSFTGFFTGAALGAALLAAMSAGARILAPARDRLPEPAQDPIATDRDLDPATTPAAPPDPTPPTAVAVPDPPPAEERRREDGGAPPVEAPASSVSDRSQHAPSRRTGGAGPPRTPEMLFEEATRARDAGAPGRAAELYAQLVERHPQARASRTACILAGRLYLNELDRPERALYFFRRYLARSTRGSLVPEALAGKAEALSRLGRHREAAATLRTLQERHPRSAPALTPQ